MAQIESRKLDWSAHSKVGSMSNTTYKPGGGNVKVGSQKLEFKERATSKVGSKDNLQHKPGGGDIKVRHLTPTDVIPTPWCHQHRALTSSNAGSATWLPLRDAQGAPSISLDETSSMWHPIQLSVLLAILKRHLNLLMCSASSEKCPWLRLS